jgi:hypothetical protein
MSRNGKLRDALKDFVSSHPDGWGHSEWEELLEDLRRNAIDTGDGVAIGAALERERLLERLERAGIKGLGPKRRTAIAECFGRLWELQRAAPEDLVRSTGIPQPVAEEVLRAVRA